MNNAISKIFDTIFILTFYFLSPLVTGVYITLNDMKKIGYVYIMTNKHKTTLYIGVTNNLIRRVHEHKNHFVKNSFTDRYNLEYCIYYEEYPYFYLAIKREKELKKWNRQRKEALIKQKNPEWRELVNEFF